MLDLIVNKRQRNLTFVKGENKRLSDRKLVSLFWKKQTLFLQCKVTKFFGAEKLLPKMNVTIKDRYKNNTKGRDMYKQNK